MNVKLKDTGDQISLIYVRLYFTMTACVSELIDFLNYTNMNDTFEQETIAILSVIFI